MKNLALCIAIAAFLPCQGQAENKTLRILVVAAGRALSDREVQLQAFVQDPTPFRKSASLSLSGPDFDRQLETSLVHALILEDARLSSGEKMAEQAGEAKEFLSLRNRATAKVWADFLQKHEVTELELRQRLRQRLYVESLLEARVRLSLVGQSDLKAAQKQALADKAIEDWVSQLKSRYRVQRLEK